MRFDKKIMMRIVLGVALTIVLGYSFVVKSETKLLPFQGRLADDSGKAIQDGALVVQFKMYDALEGGNPVWRGEKQKLSVNDGLVSTVLGLQASLEKVDFSRSIYLEITVDANGDEKIGPEDMTLSPRQCIIPAIYTVQAGDADKLKGYDWSVVFSNGDPQNGKIPGTRLEDESVTSAKIAQGAVDRDRLADKAVRTEKIADKTITSQQIENGTITLDNLKETLAEIIKNRGLKMIPPGSVAAFAGDKVPTGWLLCDGRILKREEHPRLYDAIKTSWGAGPNEGEFKLPDLRGMFVRGVNGDRMDEFADPDVNARTNIVSGGNMGNKVGSYQKDGFKEHFHLFAGDIRIEEQHDKIGDWEITFYGFPKQRNTGGMYRMKDDPGGPGGAGGKENRPVNAYVNYIIKE